MEKPAANIYLYLYTTYGNLRAVVQIHQIVLVQLVS